LGAYTKLAWNSYGQWNVDTSLQSFLFSLTNNIKFKQDNALKVILNSGEYGPYFGESPDFSIVDKANQKKSTAFFNSTFKNYSYPGNKINTNNLVLGS
jgi:hypothetical protein